MKTLYSLLVSLIVLVAANPTQAETFYFHNDQLGTPQVVTDANQQVVWQGEYSPFGEVTEIVNIITQNLRFSGQYFDVETGIYYNYFRDYSSDTGRYLESDRIGLNGGINTYSYGNQSPLIYHDPDGQVATVAAAVIGAVSGAVIGGIVSYVRGGKFSEGAINGAIAGGVAGLTLGVGGVAIAGRLGGGVIGGIGAGGVASTAGNIASQTYGLASGQQCEFDYQSLGISAVAGGLFGGYSLRPYTATNQTVTSWGPAGVIPNLNPTRWVMTGSASPRNWIQSGRAPQYPYTNSVTSTVPSSSLSWPSGIESFKGFFGQRVIK